MNSAGRLGLFAAGLAVAFGAAYATASAVAPPDAANSWQQPAPHPEPSQHVELDEPTSSAPAQHTSGAHPEDPHATT